jgi:hypothetical protein
MGPRCNLTYAVLFRARCEDDSFELLFGTGDRASFEEVV